MRVILHNKIRIRKEHFGSILLVPLDLERPDVPQFFKLNKLGTAIIERCRLPISIDKLTSMFNNEHGSSIEEELKTFIAQLLQFGILMAVSTSGFLEKQACHLAKENLRNIPKLSAPLSAFIEVTDKCVLQCIHCYTKSKKKILAMPELRFHWISQLLCDLAELGVMTIGFGGGEPTLDPDLYKYIKYCSSVGIKTAISTSGVLMNEKKARALKEAGLGIAQISLDGPFSIHEIIRGQDTYVKAIKALETFVKLNVETRVAMTVSSINWQYMEETAKLAFKHGADRFVVFRYMPSGRSGKDLSLSKITLKKVTERIVMLEEKHPDTVIGYEPLCFFPHLVKEGFVLQGPCNAGSDVLNICADGKVTPCPHMRNYHIGTYPYETLKEIWKKTSKLGKEIISNPPAECAVCEFEKNCGGGCCSHLINNVARTRDSLCWKK